MARLFPQIGGRSHPRRQGFGDRRRVCGAVLPASLVAAIVPWFVALAQLLRVLLRVRVTAGSHDIPPWLSGVAFTVLAAWEFWLWREPAGVRDPAVLARWAKKNAV